MWDKRYRPVRFSDVLGQESAALVLKARLVKGTALDTSYIFSGGHGQGKTTLARILARAMLCQDLQSDGEPCNVCNNCKEVFADTSQAFTETDAASNGTIDHMRKIVKDLPFAIQGAEKRIYLFDEMHRMSAASQDVLLKPIEEAKFVGIFCTTEAEKIRGPIRSRCEEYKIRSIPREDLLTRMCWILTQEGVGFEEDAVLTVIDASHSHVRDIINTLEMIAQLGEITSASVREYLNLSVVSKYYEILLSLGTPSTAIQLVEMTCDQVGPEAVYEGLAEAAMTSYRMANNMYVDYTYVDKPLAQKLQLQYGDSLLQLAEHFLGTSKATRLRLLCDVMSCVSGTPPAKDTSTKTVLVQVQASPAQETASTVAPTAAPVAKVEVVLPTPPVAETKRPSSPPPSDRKVGNLGSDDARALTSLDDKAVRKDMPRGTHDADTRVLFKDTPKGRADLITAEEWRISFEQRLKILGVGAA